jgi:hypothetical protein
MMSDSATTANSSIIASSQAVKTAYDRGSLGMGLANNSYAYANTANTTATAAFDQANTGIFIAVAAHDLANTANITATAAFIQANTGINNAASASLYANTALTNLSANVTRIDAINVSQNTTLTAAFTQANTGVNNAASASLYANTGIALAQASFNAQNSTAAVANTKFASSGGTITGAVTISSDLAVTGNLVVSGIQTIIDTNTIRTDDSLIELAANNIVGDVLDIGFFGSSNTGTSVAYHGLVRQGSGGTAPGNFYLFKNLATDPTTSNTINYAGTTRATLVANVTGGIVSGLASAVAIADGGTNATTFTANQSTYFDGTKLATHAAQTVSNVGLATGNTITAIVTDSFGRITSLTNDKISIPTTQVTGLATSATTDTANASNITSGTLPNARLVSIPNSSLANTSVTINGTAVALGASGTVTAAAGTLTGATLNATITGSSLTSVGIVTTGTWSGSFGAVSGANLTSLTASNLTGTIPTGVLGNSSLYVGTTAIALNRASLSQYLSGVSISGTAMDIEGGAANQLVYQTAANTTAFLTAPVTTNTFLKFNGTNLVWDNAGAAFNQSLNTTDNVTFANTTASLALAVGTASLGATGEIRASGTVTAYASSDERLKENIVEISAALTKIDQIRGVSFDWSDEEINRRGGIVDNYFVRKHDIGVIAQEIESVLPEIVVTRDDGYKAVKYELIVPLLIQSIKELSEKVKQLENK